jgi:hypothetical protein
LSSARRRGGGHGPPIAGYADFTPLILGLYQAAASTHGIVTSIPALQGVRRLRDL